MRYKLVIFIKFMESFDILPGLCNKSWKSGYFLGNGRTWPIGFIPFRCYHYSLGIKPGYTFDEAKQLCSDVHAELVIPKTPEESKFIASIGSTFLGIQGKRENGTVTWYNIYTMVII